jgi:hypothetical protein
MSNLVATQQNLITIGEFMPCDVWPHVITVLMKGANRSAARKLCYKPFVAGGMTYMVNMSSLRYAVFSKSMSCACCGLVGSKLLLQKYTNMPGQAPDRAHFNLYGEDPVAKCLVLFTKDHIKPRAIGGPNHASNMATMCKICNEIKADKTMMSMDAILRLRAGWAKNKSVAREEGKTKKPMLVRIGYELLRIEAGRMEVEGSFLDELEGKTALEKAAEYLNSRKFEFHVADLGRGKTIYPSFRLRPIRKKTESVYDAGSSGEARIEPSET